MKPIHHPNVERCAKLKAIKFPMSATGKCFYRGKHDQDFIFSAHIPNGRYIGKEWQDGELYYIPSVPDLLDEIPRCFMFTPGDAHTFYAFGIAPTDGGYTAEYRCLLLSGDDRVLKNSAICKFEDERLANALCDIIFWLVENGHKSF